MITLREAAQQTLEWLDQESWPGFDEWVQEGRAIRASLRAALAEPQEPVGWMVYTEGGKSAYVTDNPTDLVGAYRALPLYTR